MALNNPYAAYQRYATVKKPQTSQNNSNVQEINKSAVKPSTGMVVPPVQNNTTNGVNQYLENTVLSASPEELTLMLYDGALKFMNQAVIHIQMKNIEKSHAAIVRAQDIFIEFMSTLNMDYEMSKNLYSLYEFINNNLTEANIKKDINLLREMISFTRELRETWAQAMKIAKKG